MTSSSCPPDSDKKRQRNQEYDDEIIVSPEQEENQERRVKRRTDQSVEESLIGPSSEREPEPNCGGDDDDDEQVHMKEKLQQERKSLHIYRYREMLLEAVDSNHVLIIVAETGCGKTTQIPQYLYEAGYGEKGRIGCTQPHGFAARSAAARVSQELGIKLGHDVVGYSIPFEECTSEKNVLRYMSDGTLLHQLYGQPDLRSYSVLMLDDTHERTLSTDILVGLLKDILRDRTNLKLLISTATFDCAEKLCDFFDLPPILDIRKVKRGRNIELALYQDTTPLDAAINHTLYLHQREPSGDILVFLKDREEIEAAAEQLQQREEEAEQLQQAPLQLSICPFYENMPPELEAQYLETTPQGARKVVLATSIAETFWPTKAGVSYVIDSGCCTTKSYDPRTEMESLEVTSISKASAMLRANPIFGKCCRLSTVQDRVPELPEVQRSNLTNVVLTLRHLGVSDLTHFPFLDPPNAEALSKALEVLFALGALQNEGQLTEVGELTVVGELMAEFPMDVMLSKAIVASDQYKCAAEIISIVAMLTAVDQYGPVFYRPADRLVDADNARMHFHDGNVGDHIALLRVYNEWKHSYYSDQWCHANFLHVRTMKRARAVRDQLERLLEKFGIELSSNPLGMEPIKKAITSGFFSHCAKLHHGSYRRVKHPPMTLHIHSSSGLATARVFPRWVVYHNVETNHLENPESKYMRQVTEINPEWLLELAPHYYQEYQLQEIAD